LLVRQSLKNSTAAGGIDWPTVDMESFNRRKFLRASGGWLAAGALAGCSAHPPIAPRAPHLDASRFTALRRFTRTRYGDVAHVAQGSGPEVLLLHGFPLNGFQWRGTIEGLAGQARCIAPDFLGMGHSSAARGQPVSPDAQVLMLMALLDELRIARVHVIANDSGGAVAQLLVARQPQRVRSLLLTNCDTEVESPPAAMRPVIALARQGKLAETWFMPWAADPALARSETGIGGMCYADRAHPTDEALHMYFSPLVRLAERRAALHRYATALEGNPLAGIRAALRASRVPTRIAWGQDDTIFSARSAQYLAECFGNRHGFYSLPNAKLFWPEERPDIVITQARLLWESAGVHG
jgi:haloalkane dehalogenase